MRGMNRVRMAAVGILPLAVTSSATAEPALKIDAGVERREGVSEGLRASPSA